jgi:hypothetical protein
LSLLRFARDGDRAVQACRGRPRDLVDLAQGRRVDRGRRRGFERVQIILHLGHGELRADDPVEDRLLAADRRDVGLHGLRAEPLVGDHADDQQAGRHRCDDDFRADLKLQDHPEPPHPFPNRLSLWTIRPLVFWASLAFAVIWTIE